ncbi:MAG TPA: family 16 glycoside hydrolase [Planctomycetaceae bacterium]|jgi:serine/threonine protein kinase|nr:family 16 glycoside hydrolase [Planctomycetaceae bacterium]
MNDPSAPAEPKDQRVQAALGEYLERVDRGEVVDLEEFLSRHAEIADQLRSFIAAEDEVRKLAAAEIPRGRAEDSTKSFAGRGQETVAPQSMAKRTAESGGICLTGQFGRYRIIRALGKGAMGTVYLAEDTHIERQVALKTPHFTEDPTGEQKERFFREARAAGNLRHPHICPIYDFGQIDGKHYISMAYIEGHPLSAFSQAAKPQTERQILLLIRKLALALQEAHDHGIVHRDLKPANIMVDKNSQPIIMDFGLAQQVRRNEDVRLTQTGNILGTPAFMSPEQVEGELDKIGPSTDQYSLGVILYELLTGQLPFQGSVIAVMGQILTKEPPPPSQLRPDLDLRIEAVCLKMMAKNPSDRFASLKTVADELATILKSPAAKSTSKEQPASSPAPSPAGDRRRADVGASQVLKSLKQKAVTENDLASLEELARKCYTRRDFEQVIQITERIPEERRNAALQSLLEKSRGKADDISFLICDIDEAVRLNDRQRALKKADELLKIKPGHHRAMKIQEEFAGYGEGGAARIGTLRQFTQRWNEGGWIPWSVLAFGLAVFAVMLGVMVIYLGKTAIVIDVRDPDIKVEVTAQGKEITITGRDEEKVYVEPGEHQLKVNYAGLEALTQSFELMRGQERRVKVSLVDKKLAAEIDSEPLALTPSGRKAVENVAAGATGQTQANDKQNDLAKKAPLSAPDKTQDVASSSTARAQSKPGSESLSSEVGREEAEPGGSSIDPSNNSRRLWRGSNSSFEKTELGKWRETLNDRPLLNSYDEVARTKEYVELLDRSRGGGVKVRLRTDDYLIQSIDNGEAWRSVESGGWQQIATARPPQQPSEDGFVPLFNGKDLTGWRRHPNWRVENGILTGSGPGTSFLFSERGDFTDFEIRVEARINDGGNSDVHFRAQSGSRAKFPPGYEAQINSTHRDPNKTGSLYIAPGGIAVSVPVSPAAPGEWFKMDVLARGLEIVVKVNGVETAHYWNDRFVRGHIALEQHDPQSVVEFRTVEIRELSETTGSPRTAKSRKQSGPFFESIFNGTDLSGWQGDPRIWAVEDGTIVAHGDRNPANDWRGNTYLIHQGHYTDFELMLQFKLSNQGNSGVQFRSVLKADGTMQGYQAEIGFAKDRNLTANPYRDLTGNLYEEATGRGTLVELSDDRRARFNAKPRAEGWNDLLVRCLGDHVVIKINGVTTVDLHDPQGSRSGFFALQSHGGMKPLITFRDIRVRDLSR